MTTLWKRGRTIWTDRQGDLICDEWWDGDNEAEHVLVAQSPANNVCTPVFLPTDHDDKVAVAAAFVDALGLECDGFRAKARAFQVGDRIKCGVWEADVLAATDKTLFFRDQDGDEWSAAVARCTLITPAEEQGEVEQSEGECEWCADGASCGDTLDKLDAYWICTRPAGHSGEHVACGRTHSIGRWNR